MDIYLISQTENNDYDTYDSAVVYARDEQSARRILPGNEGIFIDEKDMPTTVNEAGEYGRFRDWGFGPKWEPASNWCKHISQVKVTYLGTAPQVSQQGVICASFNAG